MGRHDSWTTPFLLQPFSYVSSLFSIQRTIESHVWKLLARFLLGSLGSQKHTMRYPGVALHDIHAVINMVLIIQIELGTYPYFGLGFVFRLSISPILQ